MRGRSRAIRSGPYFTDLQRCHAKRWLGIYLPKGPVMLIRSQNVRMNELRLDDVAYIDDEIDRSMGRTRVLAGDVLLNITGASIGRVAPFELEKIRANVNQHVCIIRPNTERLTTRYLSHLIASPHYQAMINRLQHGGTRQALNVRTNLRF